MPGQFLAIEGAIILGMQDMLYVTKSKAEPSNQVIVSDIKRSSLDSAMLLFPEFFSIADKNQS